MKTYKKAEPLLLEDPYWYKDAIIYELPIRAFADSNGDGIGDFRGLLGKLDYLQDLGVTALWLLPFYPSPLRDDGYDISYFTNVNSIYGNLADCKLLLREAHRRGLRIITELIVNHTSDQHPWFQRARRAPPGSVWRDFYVWSDTADKYNEARVIFRDFETSNWTWDSLAKAHYWHRFYSHQPDLNYDHPAVHEALFAALDFWLELGIDGMRLDAVPYLYEREGTNCENLPETHDFLKKLRQHVDQRFRNRMLLAEANQWPEEAVSYFGAGDECHMAFHFPLMPRLFMAIHMEDRFPVIDILQQTPPIPETSQWAIFLRNHDELTLEMVTDEDRDYMYRVYAQDSHARINLGIRRRLAPLLENHRGKIELMNGLLLSLPGTPVLYYGDEIGMGDNIYLGDRNGVRTPMQWNPERNAGFSRANPQRLFLPVIIDPEYHYQTVNVEAQQNNPHSLLWWMKRLLGLRKRFQAFSRGTLEFLNPNNRKVLAFIRRYQDEKILVVANLSRFVQYVELDLSAFKGTMPVEMLGRTALPPVGDLPYLVTLGPYAFYWLALEPKAAAQPLLLPAEGRVPVLEVAGTWEHIFLDRTSESLEKFVLGYLLGQPWFFGNGGQAKSARLVESIPIPYDNSVAFLTLVHVDYSEGEARTYVLPLAFALSSTAEPTRNGAHRSLICRLQVHGLEPGEETRTGVLYDPLGEAGFSTALLDAFARRRRFRAPRGDLVAWTTRTFQRQRGLGALLPEPALLKSGDSNTSVAYGKRFVLKVFRSVEEGTHPEVELGRALAERTAFTQNPAVTGALEYHSDQGKSMTLAALLAYVPHEGNAWDYTLDSLQRFFERILIQHSHQQPVFPGKSMLDCVGEDVPADVNDLIGPYLGTARLLGQRTAELHLALATITDDPEFAPEPFSLFYQRSLYQTVRTRVLRMFDLLREQLASFSPEVRGSAKQLLERGADLVGYAHSILDRRITADRTRCHGDYRLENLLYTGKDFQIIDFEGEVSRPLSHRRHKRSPLRDVASLQHSLYFAVRTALQNGDLRPEDKPWMLPWGRFWHLWVCVAFLKSYLESAFQASFLPRSRDDLRLLYNFYLLSRGIFVLRSALLHHPDRAHLPMQALLHLLESWERRRAVPAEAAAEMSEQR